MRTELQKMRAAAEQAMAALAERDTFWTAEVQQVRSHLVSCQQELKASQELAKQQQQELGALRAEQIRHERELQAAGASSQVGKAPGRYPTLLVPL